MENNDGGLGFKATIDIADLERQISEMEKRIQDLARVTGTETKKMDNSFKDVGQQMAETLKARILEQRQLIKEIAQDLKNLTQAARDAKPGAGKAALFGDRDMAKRALAEEQAVLLGLQRQQIELNNKETVSNGGVIASLKNWAIGLVTVTGAMKLGKSIIESTEGSAHKFEQVVAGATSGLNYFFKSIASGDFTNFWAGIEKSIKEAVEFVDVMEKIENRRNEEKIKSSKLELKISELRAATYDKDGANDEQRKKALTEIIALQKIQYDEKAKLAKAEFEANLNLASSNSGIAKEKLKDFLSEYSSLEKLIEKGEEYNRLKAAVKAGNVNGNTTSAGADIFGLLPKPANDAQKKLDELGANAAEAGKYVTQISKVTFETRNKLSDMYAASYEAEAAFGQKDRRDKMQLAGVINKIKDDQVEASKKALKAQQDVNDKVTEAELKLEESRIEIMKDGYEKRVAEAELQHKKAIAAIDKEQSDLEKAYKETGKKMPTAEKAKFDERRTNENKGLTTKTDALFVSDIEEKKKRYELYFKWVKSVGQTVANEQFKDLLKNGASYTEYVKSQMGALQAELDSTGTLPENKANQLVSFKVQYDELTGKKSALDLFKDSLTTAIDRAASLGEKLAIIAKKKEEIENGKAGIVGEDQKGVARLEVNSVQKDVDKDIQNKILTDLKGFEQKKADIQSEYAALRNDSSAKDNADLQDRINKGELDALSSLNAQQLMQSDSWKNLFANLDTLTVSQIEKLIKDIEARMADLKLNPADFKAFIDSLNKAKEKVIELNPFKALSDSFDDYRKALAALNSAKDKGLSGKDLAGFEADVKNTTKNVIASISQITAITNEVGASASAMFDSFGKDKAAEGIGTAVELMGELGKTAGGVAKIMSGDIVGGVKDVITGIMNTLTIFNKLHDKKNETRIQALAEQVKDLANAYNELGKSMERAYSTDKANMLKEQNANLEAQNALIRKQQAEEEAKKKTDNNKIKEWQSQIEANNATIAENSKYAIVEAIMGSDIKSAIDDFATAYADAWAAGEKAATKSTAVVKNLIKTAIIDMLKNKLKPEVEAFMTYMSGAMSDGIIDSVEQQKLDEWQAKLEGIADSTLAGKEKWLTDSTNSTKTDAMTGAIKSVTEETASVLAGRVNQIGINQADLTAFTKDKLSQINMSQISTNDTLRQALIYQAEIALNTRGIAATNAFLSQATDSLKKIEGKMNTNNPLVPQGIIH